VCGRLELVALRVGDTLTLQLVNANGTHADNACATDDCIPPVLDVTLSVALDAEPKAIVLQPEGRELAFTYRDGRAYFEIPRVDIHSAVEIRI
jgi:hypothetical protein